MNAGVLERADGWPGGEAWSENYEKLPGGAGVSIILEFTSRAGVGRQFVTEWLE